MAARKLPPGKRPEPVRSVQNISMVTIDIDALPTGWIRQPFLREARRQGKQIPLVRSYADGRAADHFWERADWMRMAKKKRGIKKPLGRRPKVTDAQIQAIRRENPKAGLKTLAKKVAEKFLPPGETISTSVIKRHPAPKL